MAVTRLRFYGNGSGNQTGKMYIDLARELSVNLRKLHRQKKIYTVLGGYYIDSEGSRIDFNVAPHTWVMKRAINRGFAIWRKHTAKTLENTEGMQSSKYSDFKVSLNNSQGSGSTLPAVDAAGAMTPRTGSDWNYSEVITEDPDSNGDSGDRFGFHIVGDHSGTSGAWTRISLAKSWLDSRPLPIAEDQPNRTQDSNTDPLNNLFDSSDVQDDRLNYIQEYGDQRPYDEDTFFGYNANNSGDAHNLQRMGTAFTVENSVALAPVPGFQAICGLIQIDVSANTPWELVLDVESEGEAF